MGGGGGGNLEVELSVVSIAIELFSMPADNTTEGEHVYGEEGWTEDRTLGGPKGGSVGVGFSVPQGYKLCPFCEV